MKEQSNLLRWGIPGWTLFVAFLLFVVDDYLVSQDAQLLGILANFVAFTSTWQSVAAALFVAGVGVPLGYVIYQGYFYLRWNSPISAGGLLPPFIVGRGAELIDLMDDLTIEDITLREGWRKRKVLSLEDHHGAWYYLSALLADSFKHADDDGSSSGRHAYLMDMVHSLGACQLAIVFGFCTYLLMKWELRQASLVWMPIAAVVVLLTIGLLSREDRRYKLVHKFAKQRPVSKWRKLFTVEYPAEMLVGGFLFLFVTLNPKINTSLPIPVSLIISATAAFLWASVRRDGRLEIVATIAVLTLLVFFIYTDSTLMYLIGARNWPVIASILVLDIMILAFLKNRQNARENLIAVEYYYLRSYLESKWAEIDPDHFSNKA